MQTIYIDISNKGVVPAIYAKQNEVGRKFTAVITDAGVPYVLDESALLSAWYEGTSGIGNYTAVGGNSAFTVDGNKVTIELITQMLTNDGGGVLSVSINKTDGSEIATWNIPYLVEKKPGVDSPEAESFYTAFSEIAGQVADAANRAEEAAENLENITPSAIGAATPAEVAAAVKKASPVNLLDNSDFRNPVNQRRITTVTASGYTIDRWRTYHNTDTVTVNDGYISLSARLYQPIPAGSLDLTKTYTAAAMKTDGTLLVNVLRGITEEELGNPIVYLNGQQALFRLADGGDFLWAALYEGEYTVETLPEYRSKGYGAELRECHRYYQIFNDFSGVMGAYMYAHFIRGYVKFEPMRSYSPTITMTQSQYLAPSGSADWADFSPTAAISGNTVTISGAVDALTVGLSCIMRVGFTLSAEL